MNSDMKIEWDPAIFTGPAKPNEADPEAIEAAAKKAGAEREQRWQDAIAGKLDDQPPPNNSLEQFMAAIGKPEPKQ